ncbi:VOC family protein [Nocardia yunnanensis]|uniref:VOC family protein n=1 Tax=Nocardia yunnanensis TaxID=2382165 RepID=A0A386ZHA1_9NOCA|nr:VOC family protein [Nocardia yunnanensis]AYF76891.1 VOC family protein [Nocardia yunnanensis]
MSVPTGFANAVYPAADLDASVATFTAMLGAEPVFRTPDYAMYAIGIALSSKPWVRHPLPFWTVSDIAAAHASMVAAGATALGEIADGSLAEIGTARVVNGDPATGIVDMPGNRLAVLKAADGNLIAINQTVGW